jgi:mRNA-degrading endonuclease RelE of RelBE toxin-antitoxin system
MYRYVLDCEVVEETAGLSSKHRDELVRAFRALASDPFSKADAYFVDATGRKIQRIQIGRWVVVFWPDHAAKEVRIVGIQKTRQTL